MQLYLPRPDRYSQGQAVRLRKLNILHLVASVVETGGRERYIWSLAKAQAAAGHDVWVGTSSLGANSAWPRPSGVNTAEIPALSLVWQHGIGLKEGPLPDHVIEQLTNSVAAMVSTFPIDVIHMHDGQRYDDRIVPALMGIDRRVPIVNTLHTDEARHVPPSYRQLPIDQHLIVSDGVRSLFPPSTPVMGPSIAIDEAFTRFGDVPTPAPALMNLSGPIVVHPAARRDERKGPDIAWQAFALMKAVFPAASLVYFNERERAQPRPFDLALLESIDASPYSNDVHFMPFAPDEVRGAFAAVGRHRDGGVVVSSSRREAFGLVIAEALASGAPVVATNVGGQASALNGGRAGILVPPNDPGALAAGMIYSLTAPLEVKERRRLAGLEAADRVSMSRLVNQTVTLYEQLLASGGTRRTPYVAAPAASAQLSMADVSLAN